MHRVIALFALLSIAACGKGTQSLADDPDFLLPSLTLGAPDLAGEYGRAVVFVGDFAAVGQPDRDEVHLFDAESGELVRTLRHERPNAAFGHALAVIGDQLYVGAPGLDRVFRYDPATGERTADVHVPAGEFGTALAVVGGELWVGAPGHDVGRGLVVRLALTSHVELGRVPSPNAVVGGSFGAALAETDDGAVVGAPGEAGGDGIAYLFERSGVLLHEIAGPDGGGFGSAVAAGGATVVVGAPRSEEGRAYVIEAGDGEVSRTLEGPAGGSAFGAAVGVDGPHVVVAGAADEAQVHVFDAVTGGLERTVRPAPEHDAPAGFALATRNGVALVGIFQLSGHVGLATSIDCAVGQVLVEYESPIPTANLGFGERVALVGDLVAVSADLSTVVVLFDRLGNVVREITTPLATAPRALAAHGPDRLLIGAPNASGEGRVFVFDTTNGNLVTTLQQPPAPETDAGFGAAVASDGTFIVVGAPGSDASAQDAGQAFVFDANFDLAFTLAPNAPMQAELFGAGVAVSPDGFFVGAPFGALFGGEVTIGEVSRYNRTTGAFLQSYTNDAPETGDALGTSIAVLDGRLFAGAPDDSFFDPGTQTFIGQSGAVVVFDVAIGTVLDVIRSPNIRANAGFGAAVAAAGGTLIVGEPTGSRQIGGFLQGPVISEGLVHIYDSESRVRRFVLDGPQAEPGSGFGTSVDVSDDGSFLVAGAPGEARDGLTDAGAALTFDLSALTNAVSPTPEENAEFGAATAGYMGNTILVGERRKNGGQGVVHFVDPATGATTQTVPFPDTFQTADFGHAIAVTDDMYAVSAPRASGGRVYLFNGTATTPVRTFQSPGQGGAFGESIDFVDTGTETLLLIGEPASGAAHLFRLDGTLVRTFSPPLQGPASTGFGFAARGVGDLVAIGAINNPNPDQTTGAVFVFDHTDGSLQYTLTTPSGLPGQFGTWISIFQDALAVSQPFDSVNGGAVHLFDLATGAFRRTIDAPQALGSVGFGRETVPCGDLLLIGEARVAQSGAAYLFDSLGNEVFDIESLNPSADDRFGLGLGCLDGAPIIGSPGANVNPNGAGRVLYLRALQQTPPPLFVAEQTLESPNPQTTGRFSDSVAFVGNDLAVGASLEAPALAGTLNRGAVHIFRGTDGAFQRTIRTPNVNGSSLFGVSISANATVLAVGSPGEQSGGVAAGRAYLFSPVTGQLLIAFDPPTPEAGAGFGQNVSLSVANIAIGEPGATVAGLEAAGRAHYFDCAVNQVLQSFESPNPEEGGQFGQAVATCGTRVYVGAFGENDLTGRAYCFDGFTGELIHTFEAPQGATLFGITMAKFGNDVLIGATGGNGAVYLFSGSTGQLLRTFANPDANQQLFGQSIASNGIEVLVGAPAADNGAGKAFLFNGTTAALIRELASPNPENDGSFGESSAMSGGNHLIGALEEDGGATDAGRAYLNVLLE